MPTAAQVAECYSVGCSCFADYCTEPGCCSGDVREAKRRARRKEEKEKIEAEQAVEKEVEGNNAPWPREWLKEAWEEESWT